jgi:hypothetical protein
MLLDYLVGFRESILHQTIPVEELNRFQFSEKIIKKKLIGEHFGELSKQT